MEDVLREINNCSEILCTFKTKQNSNFKVAKFSNIIREREKIEESSTSLYVCLIRTTGSRFNIGEVAF